LANGPIIKKVFLVSSREKTDSKFIFSFACTLPKIWDWIRLERLSSRLLSGCKQRRRLLKLWIIMLCQKQKSIMGF